MPSIAHRILFPYYIQLTHQCYKSLVLIAFKGQMCQLVTLSHLNLTYIFISDIRALWRSALSARVPEYQKLKNVG